MKQTLKKSVSILLSLIMVFSLFTIVPITASAEESDVYLTDFLPVSSGTATGYSTYDNHFYKIEWSGINTSETSSVKLYIAIRDNPYYYQRLRCNRNNGDAMVVLYASASDSPWESSYITNLTPGQSSDGYTSYPKLGNGASNTSIPHVYKKVCTVTCMAANTPTWNWAADGSSCTATFTCSANSSLTATVNADVTTSGNTATASVTFNGTSYTDTKTLVTNYNITYVLNGGTNASGNPSTYADDVGVSSFAAPTREHYTFGGWYDNENCTGTPVTSIPAGSSGDRTLYAKWTIDSYTVTWKNSDGSTLKTEQVNYGETPVYSGATPVKPATAQYTYFFFGWSPKISAVTGDQTYTAQFSSTFTKYKVTWKDADGTVLETDNNVSYGTTPVYNGATPAKPSDDKYSYSFKGWNPSVSSVTGDVTYTATYTKTPNPNHFSQDGDTYKIHNETGWDIFCDMLADNDKGVFTGKTVKLADDITVTRMAGSSYHDFTGTFDGQGHTLTFNSTDAVDYCAPFRYTEGTPVFCDLIIDGTINTSGAYAAGLIGHLYGNVSIERCTSRVEITSNGNSGGFVGLCEQEVAFTNCVSSAVIHCNVGNNSGFVGWSRSSNYTISFEGCVFNGKLLKNDGTGNNGGFIGWKGDAKTVTVTNCLYAPAALVEGEAFADSNSATFSREHSDHAATITNCYYTRTLGTAQGKQPYTITAGDDVTLGLSGKATEHGVSGITAYAGSNGIKYGETTLYAGSEDTVTLTVAPSAVGYAVNSVSVNDGAVAVTSNENGTYSFTMPDSNVAVTAELEEASYFDESTGTLTLKGTIHNNKGIVLPDGVNKYDVQHINVDSSGATLPQDSARLFYNFTNVTSIDLTGADTRNVTKMNYMFYYCENLTELDLSSFDTGNVRDMNYMFFRCENLTELDLSSFDTGNVTNMSYMFDCCINLTELDLSSFDTSSVSHMTSMFSGCGHLTELNLSSFDTSSVSDMNNMFFGCFLLKTIYVSEQWRTESVDYSNDMFENCRSLKGGNDTAYDGTKTDKTYAVIDKDGQPGYLTGVYTLTLPDHMEIVTDADENMKLGSRYLKGAVVTVRYTGEVKEGYSLIASANGIALPEENGVYTITIPDSNVAVTAVVDVESTFDASTGTLTLKGTVLNGGRDKSIVLPDGVNKDAVLRINVDSSGATLPQDSSRLFYNFTSVTSIDLTGADTRNVTNMMGMFSDCENLTELDLSSFDTRNVTNMSCMFYYCENLTELDLSSFDTRNVTNMSDMFHYCDSLTELDLSSFDTGNVTNMSCMFSYCESLTELDLSSFDTSSVTNMYGMFSDCYNLTELDLSSFDTSCVEDMSGMFLACVNLTELDLSSFDTSFVNCMTDMFSSCEHMTELNLSSFDTSHVTEMISMFLGCYLLKTIYVSEQWRMESVNDSNDMFQDCGSLKGGNGTVYDGSKTNREYACIDKDGQPGYLTGTYAVTVPAGITISPVNAIIDSVPFFVKGETITISPREGYIIADAFVFLDLGYDLIEIDITDNNDGTYSFTMPEGNVSMEVVTAFTDGIGAALAGHSISLEGDIAVNFYMDLDPEIAESETAYMQFTIPNGSKSETKTVFVKDAREDGGFYIFKCNVAAKDMSSIISAQLIDGDKTSTVYTYSVKEYADWLIEHKNDSAAYRNAAPLVEKMLRYGAYAKEYFDETNTLPDLDDVNIDSQFATYTSTVSDDLFDGATLSLKSQTTLSLYFTDEEELTFTCVDKNGAKRTVETVRNGSTQIARIRNIAAKELKDSFTVTVKKGETVLGVITYSPMNYCCKALNGGTENKNLLNAVKALVAYSDAANDYFTEGV